MYRLKFRKTGAGIGALIVGAGVIVSLPYNAATNTSSVIFDLPLWPILAAQLALPVAFALFTYRACPFVQQIRALLVTASFIGFFGCLANINGAATGTAFQIMSQDWLLHFNAVALGVMNLASFIAALNLMHSEQMSSFADTQVAEAQLERLKAVKVDPDTQAKWEKAAAYADRSADGRSLRSTMTNLKAISLTEPGQELKPQMRETAPEKNKEKAAAKNVDEGSLANLLDRMDDEPLPGQEMSQAKSDPALEGNSFINDSDTFSATAAHTAPQVDNNLDALEPAANFNEPFVDKFADNFSETSHEEPAAETDFSSPSGGFLDNMLDSKIAEKEETAALFTPPSSPSFSGLEQLPVEDNEAADVAALLDAFDENQGEPQIAEVAEVFEAPAPVAESKEETKPEEAKLETKVETLPVVETTKTTSFAKASSSRIPAMQPVEPPVEATTSSAAANSAAASTAAGAAASTPPSANVPSAFTTSAPGNTNNKLAAIKRRNTSTFTKLNALSASGSGQLMPTPQSPSSEGNEPDSLRSLLDRLDDDEPAAEQPARVQEPSKPIEPPFEITLDTVFKGDGTPEVAATPTTVAKPRVEAKAAEAEPVVARQPEPEPEAAQPEIIEVAEEVAEEIAEEPAQEIIELEQEVEEVEEKEEGENVFGDSEAVNLDVDKAFADLAPPEAQLDVSARALQKQAEEEAEKLAAQPAQPAQEPVQVSTDELAGEPEEEINEEAGGNLFEGGVDSEIDRVFEDLAPPEAQKEVKDVLPSKAAEPAEVAAETVQEEEEEEEAVEAAGEEGGLFGEDLGEELDKVFSDLTEGEQLEVNASTLAKVKGGESAAESPAPVKAAEPVAAASPPPAPTPAPAPAPTPAPAPVEKPAAAAASTEALPAGAKAAPAKYKEVKEFGRLSSKAPAAKTGGETSGTMKTIGKLLLDVQAVENIIKSGENRKIGSGLSTAKIISAARGEGIKNILTTIDTYEGVAGSLIVGHDGLVIASTVGTGWDKDMLGALSTALLSTSNLATKKLEIGKLRQMVMMTELTNGDGQKFKTTVLTDVDVGILAVFLEKTDLQKIDGLLDTIQSSIHGG